jgi:hypothetical protein
VSVPNSVLGTVDSKVTAGMYASVYSKVTAGMYATV